MSGPHPNSTSTIVGVSAVRRAPAAPLVEFRTRTPRIALDASSTGIARKVMAGAGGYLWGLGAAAIWSGWWTVTRIGTADGLAASDLAALRFGLAGLLLLPQFWREWKAIREVAPGLLVIMAAGAGAPYALVVGAGVGMASAGVGGAITVGLLPVFTLILSALVLRERVTRGLAAGIAFILVGATCVAASAWHDDSGSIGLVLFVGGSLMWATYIVCLQRAGLRPLSGAAVVSVGSLALYLPIWLIAVGPQRLCAAAPADLLLQAIYQSVLSTVVALYCIGRAIDRLGTTRASVFAAIVPAFSQVIAAVFLGEHPDTLELCGAALLAVGAFVAAHNRPAGRASGLRP